MESFIFIYFTNIYIHSSLSNKVAYLILISHLIFISLHGDGSLANSSQFIMPRYCKGLTTGMILHEFAEILKHSRVS